MIKEELAKKEEKPHARLNKDAAARIIKRGI
jgi:hypothetical protein